MHQCIEFDVDIFNSRPFASKNQKIQRDMKNAGTHPKALVFVNIHLEVEWMLFSPMVFLLLCITHHSKINLLPTLPSPYDCLEN